MNLRELVATLECQGKPEGSEAPVMIVDPEGRIYSVEEVVFQPSESFEGTRSDTGPTTWIKVSEC
jgi:hypothetical protein